MKVIILAGLPWLVHSPSLFEHQRADGSILIGCNGRYWQIAVNGVYGPRRLDSLHAAAQLVCDAYAMAQRENLG